jgi:TolB-like protein
MHLSPDPGDQNFCDGLTEEVVHKLAQDHRLRVITQSGAAWLEQGNGPKPRYLLEASVRRAGAEIRLTYFVAGVEFVGDPTFARKRCAAAQGRSRPGP